MKETQRAIERILHGKGADDALARAQRARQRMEEAFEEATVVDFEQFLDACRGLPDENDTHVLAAALKTQASVIVTENIKDFPDNILHPLNLDARTADDFIADTISLHQGRAVASIKLMRERLKRPAKDAETLLLDMDAEGLAETVNELKPFVHLL